MLKSAAQEQSAKPFPNAWLTDSPINVMFRFHAMLMKQNVGVGHRIILGKRLAVLIGELDGARKIAKTSFG